MPGHKPSLWIALIGVGSIAAWVIHAGCAATCTVGATQCSGQNQQTCDDGVHWQNLTDCSATARWPDMHCVAFDDQTAACSFAAGPVAECAGSPVTTCFGGAVLGCIQGYAVDTYLQNHAVYEDCEGGACVADSGTASCSAAATDGASE
jgi:hypothetical protein